MASINMGNTLSKYLLRRSIISLLNGLKPLQTIYFSELDNHILAIESDGGVFAPTGFGFSGSFSGKQNIVAEINDEKISTQEFVNYLRTVNITYEDMERVGKYNLLERILTCLLYTSPSPRD